jgi:ABC-2 type transport system ATP-binding protein
MTQRAPDNIVVLENIHKHFPKTGGYRDILTFWRRGRIVALRGVNLAVPRGSTFGLLGVNGAGKTTLLKILAGLILTNEGRVIIEGADVTRDPERVRDHLLYVTGDERTHYFRLTGRQNLRFYADLFEVPAKHVSRRVDQVLEITGMAYAASEMTGKYSTGMKQRLAIARALLADPAIFLLDEPTRSVDPLGARQLWDFIKNDLIGRQGKSVLIATHNMEEAAALCDRVAIIDKGRVRANAPINDLIESAGNPDLYRVCLTSLPPGFIDSTARIRGVTGVRQLPLNGENDRYWLELTLEHSVTDPSAIVQQMVAAGGTVREFGRHRLSLGEVVSRFAQETEP